MGRKRLTYEEVKAYIEGDEGNGKIKLVAPKDRDIFIVTIVADSNDANYITTIKSYPRQGFLDEVLDQIIDLKNNYSDHYELREYPFGIDDYEFYLEVPADPHNNEYYNCHSLESIDIKYIDENGFTWNVELKESGE